VKKHTDNKDLGKYFMYADYYVLRCYLYLTPTQNLTLTLTHRHT
jgi:hypothetical protein